MKRFLIIFFVTSALTCVGQVSRPMTKADSADLESFLKKFTKEIDLRNRNSIRQMSLQMVFCPFCLNEPFVHKVPVDTLINQMFKNRFSKLLSASKDQKPMYNLLTWEEKFMPKELKGNGPLTIYALFFVTLKPNELEKGHEGQTMAFRFVKLKDGYKFEGLESVP